MSRSGLLPASCNCGRFACSCSTAFCVDASELTQVTVLCHSKCNARSAAAVAVAGIMAVYYPLPLDCFDRAVLRTLNLMRAFAVCGERKKNCGENHSLHQGGNAAWPPIDAYV
jgi:hypothetical protein